MKLRAERRILLDLGRFNFHQDAYMVGVWSHVVLFMVGYVASLLIAASKASPVESLRE